MSESGSEKTVQRDLLGNEIKSQAPKATFSASPEQTTLDSWLSKVNSTGIEIEMIRENSIEKKLPKRRSWEKLIIAKGTRDEHILTGRYYTPLLGSEIWSTPAERRDSYPKISVADGDIIFQVKDGDIWENQVRWASVLSIGNLPNGRRGIRGYGYMRWENIQKK